MTDAQIIYHIDKMRDEMRWNDEAIIDAVAERMLDDDSHDEAREAARNRVAGVMLAREFNMFGG